MALKEISELNTATTLSPTDFFHLKKGLEDVKITEATLLSNHLAADNPHGITKDFLGLTNVTNDAQLKVASNLDDVADKQEARDNLGILTESEVVGKVNAHANLTNNPHNVTKAQVGLGSVVNAGQSNSVSSTSTTYATSQAVKTAYDYAKATRDDLLPLGSVIMWGAPNASRTGIPDGWSLCDGRKVNGMTTPNMVGRFPLATNAGTLTSDGTAGSSTDRKTGGKTSHSYKPSGSVGATTLTLAQIPAHDHTGLKAATSKKNNFNANGFEEGRGAPDWEVKSIPNEGGGKSHNHTFAGSAVSIPTVPPSYSLMFIMKTSHAY